MSEQESSSELSYGGSLASLSDPPADAPASSETQAETSTESTSSAAADTSAPVKEQSAPADAGDDLDKAQTLDDVKAFLKKRSPSREDRAVIEARLARADLDQRELIALRAQVAAKQKEQTPAVDPKQVDDDAYTDFLNRGPKAVQEYIEKAFKAREQAEEQKTIKRVVTTVAKSEAAFVQKNPEAQPALVRFRQLADSDPQLRTMAASIARGEHPDVPQADFVQWCHDYGASALEFEKYPTIEAYKAAVRAQVEAELKQGGGGTAQAGATPQRRAPLTLVGNGGGGSSETPQPSEEQSLKKAFPY